MISDYERHIKHWLAESAEAIDVAQGVFEKRNSKFTAYMTHLAVEMALKAHVVNTTREQPPKTHNLLRLSQLANLTLSAEQINFLRVLNLYQTAGRYTDIDGVPLSRADVGAVLGSAKEFLEWLKQAF